AVRNVSVLPRRLGCPLVVLLAHLDSRRRATVSRDDVRLPIDDRGDGIGGIGAHERVFPQQRATRGIDTDQFALGEGHTLAGAADTRENRRSVSRAIALPAPLDIAGVDVERRQRTLIVPTHVKNDDTALYDWRERMRGVHRHRARAGLLPQLLSG